MTFDTDSVLVQSYVLLIQSDQSTLNSVDEVPDLFNLKEAVQAALDEADNS